MSLERKIPMKNFMAMNFGMECKSWTEIAILSSDGSLYKKFLQW
jgi:hypothetical protein